MPTRWILFRISRPRCSRWKSVGVRPHDGARRANWRGMAEGASYRSSVLGLQPARARTGGPVLLALRPMQLGRNSSRRPSELSHTRLYWKGEKWGRLGEAARAAAQNGTCALGGPHGALSRGPYACQPQFSDDLGMSDIGKLSGGNQVQFSITRFSGDKFWVADDAGANRKLTPRRHETDVRSLSCPGRRQTSRYLLDRHIADRAFVFRTRR